MFSVYAEDGQKILVVPNRPEQSFALTYRYHVGLWSHYQGKNFKAWTTDDFGNLIHVENVFPIRHVFYGLPYKQAWINHQLNHHGFKTQGVTHYGSSGLSSQS